MRVVFLDEGITQIIGRLLPSKVRMVKPNLILPMFLRVWNAGSHLPGSFIFVIKPCSRIGAQFPELQQVGFQANSPIDLIMNCLFVVMLQEKDGGGQHGNSMILQIGY